MVRQLIYLSKKSNIFKGSGDLRKILEVAQKMNTSLGVTGVLLYRSGHFLQLLEGDAMSLTSLYERIKKDPRHQNSNIIMDQFSDERLFKDWSMAFREIQDDDLDKFNRLQSWDKFIDACDSGEVVQDRLLKETLIEFRYKA